MKNKKVFPKGWCSFHFSGNSLTSHKKIQKLLLSAVIGFGFVGFSEAYIGNSYINIPGTSGSWKGEGFKDWVRVEAMSWPTIPVRVFGGKTPAFEGNRMTFGGPAAPPVGAPGKLIVSMNKNNPDIQKFVSFCQKKAEIPELTFAESSEQSRPALEVGPRPQSVPEFWKYKLKGASVTECPDVAAAPDRAFVITFKDIEWLNYDPNGPSSIEVTLKPEDYPNVKPAPKSEQSKTKAFVISWLGVAGDVSEDQCPVMNAKPTEKDYFALMSKEEVAKEKAKMGEKGVDYFTQMSFRGPNRLSAVNFPGIVADPGFKEPVSKTAYGLNLDGNDGTGKAPAAICKHKNYTSVDGKVTGVDNQLYTVVGCYSGYRGKKGYRNQTSNARRSDGNVVTLIEISGIDNEANDNDVTVKIIYSDSKPIKDASGKTYLPYSTFKPSDEPQFKYFNKQLKGRIEGGVVITEAVNNFVLNTGLQDPLLEMERAQLRLNILPDENMQGVLAGYIDWHRLMTMNRSSYSENLFGFQAPGLYNSLKRNADGLKNPLTGECDGISAVYEIDAVPAFITSK